MGDQRRAYVTFVIDPQTFWARCAFDEELNAEENLETLIEEHVSSLDDYVQECVLEVEPNQVIIARSNDYGRWLRATVVTPASASDNQEVDVVFTGYGSNELVSWKDIITEVPDYVLNWTTSAECYELDDVEPLGESWSDDAIDFFTHLVLNRRLPCQCVESGNADATSRLVIFTKDSMSETVQDCLVRRKYAKRSADESSGVAEITKEYTLPFSGLSSISTAATGGIPEFDRQSMFAQHDPPAPRECPAERDFELEEQKKFLRGSVEEGLHVPTRTDDYYIGHKSRGGPFCELYYDDRMNDIKCEIARSKSTVSRSMHHPNDRRSNQTNSCREFQYPETRSSKKNSAENQTPNSTKQAVTPSGAKGRHETSVPESFKASLEEHLINGSSLNVILQFLQRVLADDNSSSQGLLICLTTIVETVLKNSDVLSLGMNVLESLSEEKDFSECLVKAIERNQLDCLQVTKTPSEEVKSKLRTFAVFLARLLLTFPDQSEVVYCVVFISETWATFNNSNCRNEWLFEVYAQCLSSFLITVANNSFNLLDRELSTTLSEIREKLLSNNCSRSVKEIFLKLLLYVQEKRTERRIKEETFIVKDLSPQSSSLRQDQSPGPVTSANGSATCSSVKSPTDNSCGSREVLAPNHRTPSSMGDSLIGESVSQPQSRGTTPMRNNVQTPKVTVENRNGYVKEEVKAFREKKKKTKNVKKMSLKEFIQTADSETVSVQDSTEKPLFETKMSCVICGDTGYHTTDRCPERDDKFWHH